MQGAAGGIWENSRDAGEQKYITLNIGLGVVKNNMDEGWPMVLQKFSLSNV